MGKPVLQALDGMTLREFLGWMGYYAEEPWDLPSRALHQWGSRRQSRAVDGNDAEAVEALLGQFFGGRRG